jgi:tRNA threonylcarbamoyladenosine biosynthesis protein TsaB
MILCLESSADPTVVGLAFDNSDVSERVILVRDHLADEVQALLAQANIRPTVLQAIAVGIGPGSFTGLRVSLAFAKGMARALNIPIWPVDSLKIIAANAQTEDLPIVVISPARRGQAHCATFDPRTLEQIGARTIANYTDISDYAPRGTALLGSGVFKLEPDLRTKVHALIPDDPDMHRPHAAHLARLARVAWSNKTAPDFSTLVPEYGLDFPIG